MKRFWSIWACAGLFLIAIYWTIRETLRFPHWLEQRPARASRRSASDNGRGTRALTSVVPATSALRMASACPLLVPGGPAAVRMRLA